MEPLHVETLLSAYELVATLLALATLGAAWQMRGERGLWLWAGAFGVVALSQWARPWLQWLQAPMALRSIGHVGGVWAATLVLLAMRAFLGRPLHWPLPVAAALLLTLGSGVLTSVSGALASSLVLTQYGVAALLAPAAWAASRAWRSQRGFAMALMAGQLWASVLACVARGLMVSPWLVTERTQAVHNNAVWLLVFIALMLVQALALQLLIQDHALRQIRRLAEIDTLTGLLNRRGFEERLLRLLRRGESGALVLAVLDVDHFKRINDSHGHSVGDAVLSGMGERLRSTLRPMDLAVRLGGEEFAVIWPQAEPGGEQRLGERLREVVANQPFDTPVGPVTVTISVGVARARAADEAPAALFSRADAALYDGKGAGRNVVRLAA
ncbi:MAG: hypothetical protein DI603_18555 [Roseateles depolymerans]|uniref:diguanylate cyclase n=1 Tax=Roseateles depolymerans TaxID=76731 RepID=A0A2W5DFZ2_9BURK|nr:MAG: hypothetical protein DI603_18555 [Roseateles depolymerans]